MSGERHARSRGRSASGSRRHTSPLTLHQRTARTRAFVPRSIIEQPSWQPLHELCSQFDGVIYLRLLCARARVRASQRLRYSCWARSHERGLRLRREGRVRRRRAPRRRHVAAWRWRSLLVILATFIRTLRLARARRGGHVEVFELGGDARDIACVLIRARRRVRVRRRRAMSNQH